MTDAEVVATIIEIRETAIRMEVQLLNVKEDVDEIKADVKKLPCTSHHEQIKHLTKTQDNYIDKTVGIIMGTITALISALIAYFIPK